MVDHTPISGAIIAGGESARFGGKPKGLCRVGGIRIIDRVEAALGSVVQRVTLIANDPEASGWLPGIPVRPDERTERGSLVGLHAALGRSDEAVIVAAWDMPFIAPALLALLVGEWTEGSSAVVPEGPRGLEPMCALYAPSCRPVFERALDRHELRLGAVVAQLPGVVRIGVERVAAIGDPARLFFNVNTPADLELAERMAAPR